jgi:hypothetical protein
MWLFNSGVRTLTLLSWKLVRTHPESVQSNPYYSLMLQCVGVICIEPVPFINIWTFFVVSFGASLSVSVFVMLKAKSVREIVKNKVVSGGLW